jgi:hypothetical protein
MEGAPTQSQLLSPVTITPISASLITSFYDAKYGLTTSGSASTTTSNPASSVADLVPPWQSTSTAPKQTSLVSSVLNGAKFFNPSASTLTAPKVANASDYKNLFALYQGINALEGLASDATSTTLTASQQQQYSTAFASGMSQLQTFLSQTSFSTLNVAEGTLTTSSSTTEGAPQETDTYTTGTIFSGGQNDPVPAFEGNVQFSMTLTNTAGVGTTVNFNLNDMGSTPRTMGNVVNYLNSQLKAAGMTTTFSDVATAGTPLTSTENGQTVDLTSASTNYALQINGTPTETVTFSAPTTAPAVYVTTASGTPATPASYDTAATPGDQTQQLMKFNASTSVPTASLVNNTTLQSAVSSALATATAPDGSVYVLTNVDGTTSGQTIEGSQDVALMKYDSAGNLVYTRTLGAESSASGYSLAVSADGSKVAVAGSVTGNLDPGDPGESSTSTNSFVSEFNSEGDEQWTTMQPSNATDVATGVAFGSYGSVYVTGTTQSSIPGGGGEIGGQDNYVRSYSASGAITSTIQYGSTGTDTPGGLTVSGNSVYVAGNENGNAVVRQFNIGSGDKLTAGAVQNLGSLQGGSVAGIGVSSNGSIVVGGSTGNADLGGLKVQTASQGGSQGFVATLSPGLTASSSNTVSYLQTSGAFTATGMTMSGNQAYLTGTVAETAPSSSEITDATAGYVAAVDTTSGKTTWSQSFQGTDYQAQPTSVSVAATGASVLDQLGLPTSIDYSQSTLLVDNTSLRPGDSFYVQTNNGTPQQITISATDTLQSLATEIERATGYNATATTSTVSGQEQLKIVPANTTNSVTLSAGPEGSDALSALGLSPGQINDSANATSTASHTAKVSLGLNLSSTLNLDSTTSAATALKALQLAAAKIENAYQSLVNPTSSTSTSSSTTTTSAADSAYIAYINSQTANYQLALSRLGG